MVELKAVSDAICIHQLTDCELDHLAGCSTQLPQNKAH
jgi:hypothetical protein